jgi:Tfp pilus assembly protein PilF
MSADVANSTVETRRAEALEAVFAAVRSGDLDQAKRLASNALSEGIEHPVLLNLRALGHEEEGRFDRALTDLRRAHFLAPADFAILNACGLCLARMERLEEALRCYDRVVAMQPDFGPAWFNRGWVLEQSGEAAKAAQSYAKAAAINPENAQAWANMAHLAARRGDDAATRAHADQALAVQPGHPTAILALAEAELREPLVAEDRIRGLLAGPELTLFDRGSAFGQLGDVLDALDRPVEAFAAYTQSNTLFRTEAAPRFEAVGQPTVLNTLAWLVSWADALDGERWTAQRLPVGAQAGELQHVFLLGFPRSGTTLIESVLSGHPDVASLEERATLNAAVLAFLGDPRGASRLATASSGDLQSYRDDYWARVKSFGVDASGKIFIDKNPFNTMKLPLIYRLFPDAKIIFVVRDPRDVVLSCFRRRFNLNGSTYEFLDLKRTAIVYDRTMRLAEISRDKQRSDEYTLVYERLIEDFSGEAKAVCAFIGADWRPELLDFSARAHRGQVASASSAQIARGFYSDGAGQWRRYRAELAPVLDILAPWVERFGYPAD